MVSRPRTITECDIWRTARALIGQYCDHAAIHAAQRAGALLAEGDLEGCRVWKRVLQAINAIGQARPTEGERLN
jgi:hypothetical protein